MAIIELVEELQVADTGAGQDGQGGGPQVGPHDAVEALAGDTDEDEATDAKKSGRDAADDTDEA